MSLVNARLRSLPPASLVPLRGIEKEGLRVRPDGKLALTPHPAGLGSALTHPGITTDFSESQLELITSAHPDAEACLAELRRLHQVVYSQVGDEVIWCASMPCNLPDEPAIPLGRYGSSNIGRAKTVYRTGLAHRYGRRMQMISGIHYNFSVPEAVWRASGFADANEAYFALIRNFRRHAWLLLYLFGASPAVCACFVEGRAHDLVPLARGTLHLPYATSLRMGRLGYLSEAQDALSVSCNDLESYTRSLVEAMTKPYPPYEAIGLREGDEYRQLATSLLQMENEFYSTIRPKRIIRKGERPIHALRERGVQYVEARVMDLDPFEPVGISVATMKFLDVFLLHCLLADSPPDSAEEVRSIGSNKQRVASRGREPGLRLDRGDGSVALREWAGELLDECAPVAAALDTERGGEAHRAALASAKRAVDDPDTLPSARVLKALRERFDGSFSHFVLSTSLEHRELLRSETLPADVTAHYAALAATSLDEQRRLEAADAAVPFEAFRQRYLAPESLVV